MNDYDLLNGTEGEIEALIRNAANFVRASEQLRPRVLEGARAVNRRKAIRHRLSKSILLLVCFAVLSAAVRCQVDRLARFGQAEYRAAGSLHAISQAESSAAELGDFGWSIVAAYSDIRYQQAKALCASQ